MGTPIHGEGQSLLSSDECSHRNFALRCCALICKSGPTSPSVKSTILECVDPLSEMAAQPEFGNPDMARDASVLLSVCGPEAIAAAAATVAAKGNTDVPQTHRIL